MLGLLQGLPSLITTGPRSTVQSLGFGAASLKLDVHGRAFICNCTQVENTRRVEHPVSSVRVAEGS